MAKDAPRRIGGRTLAKIVVVIAIFGVGAVFGGSLTSDDKANDQRQQIVSCLPLADTAALDACLGDVR